MHTGHMPNKKKHLTGEFLKEYVATADVDVQQLDLFTNFGQTDSIAGTFQERRLLVDRILTSK